MTVDSTSHGDSFVLIVKFDGCASDSDLDPIDIMFPLDGNDTTTTQKRSNRNGSPLDTKCML